MSENDESKKNEQSDDTSAEDITVPCCSEQVHIAYRGKADDRLYMVRDRKWQEVKYYQANGLRAFCAVCRHRVL